MSTNLSYSLGLDSNPFTKGIDAAKQSMSNFKSSASGFEFPGIVKLAAGLDVAKAAFSAIGSVIGPVKDKVMEFSKAASAVESTKTALIAFTGSAKEASKAAAQVAKFAATPPFGLEETKAAAKALLATGTEVGNLTTELTVMGNIAAAADMPIEELGKGLTKAASMGYVEFEALKQMMERGIPVADALAKEMGVPKESIKRMAEEGRISLGNLKAAFNNLGGEGGKFAGVLDRMTNDTAGLWATLSGSVDVIYAKLGEPINDMLRPMLKEAIAFVDDMGDKLDIVMQMVKDAHKVGKLGELVGDALTAGIGKAINYIGGMFNYASDLAAVFFSGSADQIDAVFGKGTTEVFSSAFANAGKMVGWLSVLVLTKLSEAFLDVVARFHAALAIGMDYVIRKIMDGLSLLGVGDGGGEGMSWSQAMSDANKVFGGFARDAKAMSALAKDEMLDATAACVEDVKGVVEQTGDILKNGIKNIEFKEAKLVDVSANLERLGQKFDQAKDKNDAKKKEEEGTQKKDFQGASNAPQAPMAIRQQKQPLYGKLAQMEDNLEINRAIGNSQFTKAVRLQSHAELKQLVDKWMDAGKTEAEANAYAAEEMKQNARADKAVQRANNQGRMSYLQEREGWKKAAGQTEAQKMAREKAKDDGKDYDSMTAIEQREYRDKIRNEIKQNRKQEKTDEATKKNTPQENPTQKAVESIKESVSTIVSYFENIAQNLQLA